VRHIQHKGIGWNGNEIAGDTHDQEKAQKLVIGCWEEIKIIQPIAKQSHAGKQA